MRTQTPRSEDDMNPTGRDPSIATWLGRARALRGDVGGRSVARLISPRITRCVVGDLVQLLGRGRVGVLDRRIAAAPPKAGEQGEACDAQGTPFDHGHRRALCLSLQS